MPVFLIQPIWNFKRDVGKLKEVLLNLGTEVTFIPKHHTVMVFPSHIIKIMDIVYACRCHVIRMYDTPYSADSMEFIAIIVRTLRGTISPIGRSFNIITPHGAAFRPDVPADFHRFGVYAEHIFGTIYGNSHLLADFLGKPRRQLTSGVELPSADQIWQIVLTVVVQTMKKQILAVKPECFGCYCQSHDFEVGKLGDYAATAYISMFIHTISGEILADSEDSDEICYEVAHKQTDSS